MHLLVFFLWKDLYDFHLFLMQFLSFLKKDFCWLRVFIIIVMFLSLIETFVSFKQLIDW